MAATLLTVEEAAKILRVSDTSVYRLVRRKELTAVKIGVTVRIRLEDLEEFILHNLTITSDPS